MAIAVLQLSRGDSWAVLALLLSMPVRVNELKYVFSP